MAGKKSTYRQTPNVKRYKSGKKYQKKRAKDFVTKVRFNSLKRMPGFDPYASLPGQVIKKGKEARKKWAKTVVKRFPKFFISTGRKKYMIDDAKGYLCQSAHISHADLSIHLVRADQETSVGGIDNTYFLSAESDIRFRIMQSNDLVDYLTHRTLYGDGKPLENREATKKFLVTGQLQSMRDTAVSTAENILSENNRWSLMSEDPKTIMSKLGSDISFGLAIFDIAQQMKLKKEEMPWTTEQFKPIVDKYALDYISAATGSAKSDVVVNFWKAICGTLTYDYDKISDRLCMIIATKARATYMIYLYQAQRIVQDGLHFGADALQFLKSNAKLAVVQNISASVAKLLGCLGFKDISKKSQKINRNNEVPQGEKDQFLTSEGNLKNSTLERLILYQLHETSQMRAITNSSDKICSLQMKMFDNGNWTITTGIDWPNYTGSEPVPIGTLQNLQDYASDPCRLLVVHKGGLAYVPGGLAGLTSHATKLIQYSASIGSLFLQLQYLNPENRAQQSASFVSSVNWYQRNGYVQQEQKLSLRLKPAAVEGNYSKQQLAENFAYFTADQLMQGTTNASANSITTMAMPKGDNQGSIGSVDFGLNAIARMNTISGEKNMRVAFSILQAQKFAPTTFIIDYDEKEISKLALRNRARGKRMPDQIVHLHPDSAWFTFVQLDTIAKELKAVLTQMSPQQDFPKWEKEMLQSIQDFQATDIPRNEEDFLKENFSTRFYDIISKRYRGKQDEQIAVLTSLQPTTIADDKQSAFIYHVIYSCLKSARISSKMAQRESSFIGVEQQMYMVWKYFDTMVNATAGEPTGVVQIQLSVPTFRVKYFEFIRRITVVSPQILAKIADTEIPISSSFVRNRIYAQRIHESLYAHQFPRPAPNFRINFTLTASSTYRRRHILPGLHLLSFLQRGRSKSVIKGRILSNYTAFGPLTPSSGSSGLVGDSMALITGKFTSLQSIKEAFSVYQDGTKGVQSSWRALKAPLLNLIGKNQIKMMHTFFQMSNTVVAANSPWGYACIKLRNFLESLETAGFDVLNPQYNNQYRVHGEILTNTVGTEMESFTANPWVIGSHYGSGDMSDAVPWSSDSYTPVGAASYSRTYIDIDGNWSYAFQSLAYLTFQYRVKNLCVQEINRSFDITVEFMQQLGLVIQKISQAANLVVVQEILKQQQISVLKILALASQAWNENLLPVLGKMQQIRDSVTSRQQTMLHLLFCVFTDNGSTNYNGLNNGSVRTAQGVQSTLHLITKMDIVGWIATHQPSEFTQEYLVKLKEWSSLIAKYYLDAVSKFHQGITDSYAVSRLRDVVRSDDQFKEHYTSFAQALVVMSSFKQMMNQIIKQKKYDSSSPYWVDCMFGTLLTHGLDSDLASGQKLDFDVLAQEDVRTSFDHVNRRKYFNTNDQVFQARSYFATENSAGNLVQAAHLDYMVSQEVAQAIDAVFHRVAIQASGISALQAGNDYQVDTVSKAITEHLEQAGLTSHSQRRGEYLALFGNQGIFEETGSRQRWQIPVDTSGVLYNQDPEAYQLPLTFNKDNIQRVKVSLDYTIKNQQVKNKSESNYKEIFRFFVATTTVPIPALVASTMDIVAQRNVAVDSLALRRFQSTFNNMKATAGFIVPITVLERIIFEVTHKAVKERQPVGIIVRAVMVRSFRAFQMLNRVYGTILNTYVQCAYERLSDYDVYMVLNYLRNFLRKFGADVFQFCCLMLEQNPKKIFAENTIAHWDAMFNTVPMFGSDDFVAASRTFGALFIIHNGVLSNQGCEMSEYNSLISPVYQLWAELIPPRTSSQRLKRDNDPLLTEVAKYGKIVSRKTRRAIYQIQRDPFNRTRFDDTNVRNAFGKDSKYESALLADRDVRALQQISEESYKGLLEWQRLYDRHLELVQGAAGAVAQIQVQAQAQNPVQNQVEIDEMNDEEDGEGQPSQQQLAAQRAQELEERKVAAGPNNVVDFGNNVDMSQTRLAPGFRRSQLDTFENQRLEKAKTMKPLAKPNSMIDPKKQKQEVEKQAKLKKQKFARQASQK